MFSFLKKVKYERWLEITIAGLLIMILFMWYEIAKILMSITTTGGPQ